MNEKLARAAEENREQADRLQQASTPPEPFPYEQPLAFYRGQLAPPEYEEVQRQLEASPRWRAHYESVRFLDRERLAARQDRLDLAKFSVTQATPCCRAVASTGGSVLRHL